MIKIKIRTKEMSLDLKTESVEKAIDLLRMLQITRNLQADGIKRQLNPTFVSETTTITKPVTTGKKIREIKKNIEQKFTTKRRYSKKKKNPAWTADENNSIIALMENKVEPNKIFSSPYLLRTHTSAAIKTRFWAIVQKYKKAMTKDLYERIKSLDVSHYKN